FRVSVRGAGRGGSAAALCFSAALFVRRPRLFRRDGGSLLLPKAWRVGAVEKRFRSFGRQVFEIVDRALDVVFPHLARQFVQKLDPVAIGVVDVDAVRYAMVDAPIELDAAALEEL